MNGPGRLALVLNPEATRVDAGVRARVVRALTPYGLAEVLPTRGPGQAGLLAARAAREGASVVVVLGGDGTVQQAASSLADGRAALLPLPGGSTNVFARAVGWPRHIEAALAALGPALERTPRALRLGAISLDGRQPTVVCVNAGVGVDAAVVHWVEGHPRAKHRLRQGAFAAAALGPGGRELLRGPSLQVAADGAAPVGVAACLLACGSPYTYAGGAALDLLPRAGWDGRTEWLALSRAAPARAGRVAAGALRGGRHLAEPLVLGGLARGEVRVTAPDPVPVQADGEAIGRATDVVMRAGPALLVVTPG